ncbi:MAG TPA: ABC transporter permease [Acidimicrobiales bacterium]|nr:ABC transporter permease [Acidimicrobiales bacterium]
MNGFRQSWLVAKRELRERSRSRAFMASVVIMIVAVVIAVALPTLIDTTGGTKDIGLTGSTPATLPAAIAAQAQAVGTKTRIHDYTDLAEAEQAVRDGKIDVLVIDVNQLEWQGRADEQLKAVVTAAIQISALQQRANTTGISDTQLAELLAPVNVISVEIGQVAGRSPDDETAAFIITLLLFMTVTTYGAMVLSGVVEEKSSRVVEVLLARIPARNLLAGKIAGIGLLGLAQVTVTALAALIAATTISDVDLPAVRGGVLAWAVLFFVLGYALYATVFGALGSLASRPEDAQSAAGPVSVLLVLVYFVSFAAIGSPDTNWARAVSWVPITAPIAMPTRMAMGAAAWWEPIVAAGLTTAAIGALVVVGGRVYASAVLHNGPTLKLRDAWHLRATAAATTPERRTVDRSIAHHNKTAVIALAAALAVAGFVGVVTGDVIIGVAVGAALFALVDRASKGWGVTPSREADRASRSSRINEPHETRRRR